MNFEEINAESPTEKNHRVEYLRSISNKILLW